MTTRRDCPAATPMLIYRLVEQAVTRCPAASEEKAFREVASTLGSSVRSVREHHRQVRAAYLQQGLRCPTCADLHGA